MILAKNMIKNGINFVISKKSFTFAHDFWKSTMDFIYSRYSFYLKGWFVLIFLLFSFRTFAFTVVIDAGHGGKDPGAVGAVILEKDLNLDIAKRVAKHIQSTYPDVKVLMTRSTDVYLTLQERADFVNKNHANLFICIHTNAAENKKMNGVETYVLGIHKMESNLDVAMRENSVITLEDDYQTKYQGFDPNSVESYIMFEFMQDQYIDKSLAFADLVQKQFVNTLQRYDRGVRQAGFWVLHKSACPSVLIELGFLSNKAEEQYLATEKARQDLSKAIFNAFQTYYSPQTKEVEPVAIETKPSISSQTTTKAVTSTSTSTKQPVFRVQIFSSRKVLKANDSTFKGLKNCRYTKDGEWYKYTYGNTSDYNEIQKLKKQISVKFKDCFVVAFLGDEQIYVKDALKMIKK